MEGSLINHLMGGPTGTVPEVGMAATVLMYTDREPVTIVEVKLFKSGPRKGQPREIVVQYDSWRVTSGSGHDGSAQYEYEPDPRGRKESYVLSLKGPKAGSWVEKGSGGRGWKLALGKRERYSNPHL
jgi:hypothetical protein